MSVYHRNHRLQTDLFVCLLNRANAPLSHHNACFLSNTMKCVVASFHLRHQILQQTMNTIRPRPRLYHQSPAHVPTVYWLASVIFTIVPSLYVPSGCLASTTTDTYTHKTHQRGATSPPNPKINQIQMAHLQRPVSLHVLIRYRMRAFTLEVHLSNKQISRLAVLLVFWLCKERRHVFNRPCTSLVSLRL